MDFDYTSGIVIVVVFYLLYTYVNSGNCSPCSGNIEGMANEPSPQFGVSPGSAQTHAQAQSPVQNVPQSPSARHVGGSSSSGSWLSGWSDWRPWSGVWDRWTGSWDTLPSYYDRYGYTPRDYYGISLYSDLAYRTPMYDYGYPYRHRYGRRSRYGYPYRYGYGYPPMMYEDDVDDVDVNSYELVYDERGNQRIIRKAMVVG